MTDAVKIYHNPRCSKSRDTLSLLKSNGIDPEVVLYLETPADAATLRELLQMLGMSSARELMRQKEDLYKSLNLADKNLSEDALIQAMVENPKLMERPIVVAKGNGQGNVAPHHRLQQGGNGLGHSGLQLFFGLALIGHAVALDLVAGVDDQIRVLRLHRRVQQCQGVR